MKNEQTDEKAERTRRKQEAAAVAAATATLAIPVTRILAAMLRAKLRRTEPDDDEDDAPTVEEIPFDEEHAVDIPIR